MNWEVEGMAPAVDRTAQYRSLGSQLDELMELVAGEHLSRD